MRYISLISFIVLLFANSITAQSAKKYILLEQFSNSFCSICANRIPQFRSNLQGFEDDYHLISFFAPSPYPACIYYNANKPQNDARISYYGILGTPTVHVNGIKVNQGSSIVPVAVLEELSDDTSPIGLVVSNVSNGNSFDVSVKVMSHGELPVLPGGGSYVLHAIVVETLVVGGPLPNYQNHHNVFRTMLTPNTGAPFMAANAGEEVSYNFTFQPESNWNADSLVVIAFVQEVSTKDILNSGSNLDPVNTSVKETEQFGFSISPNPAKDFLRIDPGNDSSNFDFEIFDVNARVIQSGTFSGELIDVSKLPAGQFWIGIRSGTKAGVMPFVKTN
ncbi:MAG: Omp28-related outer membrane protein [Saprospiraceae bacterium]|nr:Omp28-related outer membrane protein [Saprospiraceae bacterium]